MTIKFGNIAALSPARILERSYPLSRKTPVALAVAHSDDIVMRPQEISGRVGRLLQRRHTNSLSDTLKRSLICRNCMLPGLKDGDSVLFEERQYLGGLFDPDYPDRYNIVCFWNPRTSEGMIKRLIALPKERIAITEGMIFLNGQILPEGYPTIGNMSDMAEILVPKRHVFLLADNRDRNEDSRSLGPIHISSIFGIVREVIRAISFYE